MTTCKAAKRTHRQNISQIRSPQELYLGNGEAGGRGRIRSSCRNSSSCSSSSSRRSSSSSGRRVLAEVVFCWLLNVPATCECISRTDLLRQFYVTEDADPNFQFEPSPSYTDTGPTSPSTDPITPSSLQGSHWKCQLLSHRYDSTPGKIQAQAKFEPGNFCSRGERLNH